MSPTSSSSSSSTTDDADANGAPMDALAPPPSQPTVPLDPGEPAIDGFRRVLANLADTIAANLDGTVEDRHPEFLHELRVAVRRTRSVLAQGQGVLPDDVRDRYRDTFGWLGTITTDARDLDVHVLGWAGYVAPLDPVDAALLDPVLRELEARRADAHRGLAEQLRSERARLELAAWTDWLTAASPAVDPQLRLGPFVAHRIQRLQRRLLRDGRAVTPDTPGEHLHELRKEAKKLRYMLECFGSLLDTKPRKAFVGALKALQDTLGEHQDADVQRAAVRQLARELHATGSIDTDVILALGNLSGHFDRRRRRERRRFAKRFAAYDTRGNRAKLDALLDPAREP